MDGHIPCLSLSKTYSEKSLTVIGASYCDIAYRPPEALVSYSIHLFPELYLALDFYLYQGLYLVLDSLSKDSDLHVSFPAKQSYCHARSSRLLHRLSTVAV